MLRQRLLAAFLALSALVGLLVVVSRRASGPTNTPPAREVPLAVTPSEQRAVARTQAAQLLAAIKSESASLMPDGFGDVYIGMGEEALTHLRPAAQLGPASPSHPDEHDRDEDLPNGERVVYKFSSQVDALLQVQFLTHIQDVPSFVEHWRRMSERYGTPTGAWDCPETDEAPPMRRFTWRRQVTGVMEAVLIYGSNISLTMVVSSNDDIQNALLHSRCHAVHGDAVANFPVAHDLSHGEQTPILRLLPSAP